MSVVVGERKSLHINILLLLLNLQSEDEFQVTLRKIFPDGRVVIRCLSEVQKKDYPSLKRLLELLIKISPSEEVIQFGEYGMPKNLVDILIQHIPSKAQ